MRRVWFCWAPVGAALLAMGAGAWGASVSCPVAKSQTPSDARQAFLHADYDKAASLYEAQLKAQPGDPAIIEELTQTLLRAQKPDEAAGYVNTALADAPNNAILLTAQGEVQFRQGMPWLSASTAAAAVKADLCYPRAHLLVARNAWIRSMAAAAAKEMRVAHQLDPFDPEIRNEWINTLPLRQRITELESYLASPTGDDAEDIQRLHTMLDFMKTRADMPQKACRLASSTTSTEIPFAYLMYDANRIRAFGLDVKVNDHNARLQIDTGASQIVIGRSVAQRAGLKPLVRDKTGGIGDEARRDGYVAYADSIRIGGLDFRDCVVQVLDSRNVVDSDGLIGMNVFSHFLVTLDYPMRKLTLGPLPPRPGEATVAPTLATEGSDTAAPESGGSGSQPGGSAPPPHGPFDRYIAPEMQNWTAIYRVGHDLIVPASLDKKVNKLFILDTGSWTTTVSPEAAREVTKLSSDDTTQVRGIQGRVQKVYRAQKLTFYFAGLSQPALDVPAFEFPQVSRNVGMEISGFIGATTIGQTTMHIDYRDGLVKFDYDPHRGYLVGR